MADRGKVGGKWRLYHFLNVPSKLSELRLGTRTVNVTVFLRVLPLIFLMFFANSIFEWLKNIDAEST